MSGPLGCPVRFRGPSIDHPWRLSSTPSSTSANGAARSTSPGDGEPVGVWDYGPLGVELKDNVKTAVVAFDGHRPRRRRRPGLPRSSCRAKSVASGHVDVFNDPLVECLNCHKRHRQDHMQEPTRPEEGSGRPRYGADDRDRLPGLRHQKGQWTEPRDFNMMLKTYLGPIETEEGLHYLRPRPPRASSSTSPTW